MKNKVVLSILALLCIVSFGLFIYPGLYKYDKLQQQYPVKINRLTGSTQVLFPNGWRSMDNSASQMEDYKVEIEEKISDQSEKIKNDVLASIRSELDAIKLEEEPSVFDSVRNRDASTNETVVNEEYFTKGDSMEKVKEIMGTPDGVSGAEPYENWQYGLSTVSFKDGKVTGWRNTNKQLKVK